MNKVYMYVYNVAQVNFFLQNGLVPIMMGYGKKNKDAFLKFERTQEFERVFTLWINS